MLKLRNEKGKVLELSKNVKFVEICDLDGNLAAVVYMSSAGRVKIIQQDDEDFARYVTAYNPKLSSVINNKPRS